MDRQREFSDFVRARELDLLRFASLLTGSRVDAEDLLQTALVKLYVAWPRVTNSPGPEAYVRRVIVTTNISNWRRARTRIRLSGGLVMGDSPGEISDHGSRSEMVRMEDKLSLWPHIRRLPPRQRTVLILRYYLDLTEQATSTEMNCSIGTVKKYHARAIAALRVEMPIDDLLKGGR